MITSFKFWQDIINITGLRFPRQKMLKSIIRLVFNIFLLVGRQCYFRRICNFIANFIPPGPKFSKGLKYSYDFLSAPPPLLRFPISDVFSEFRPEKFYYVDDRCWPSFQHQNDIFCDLFLGPGFQQSHVKKLNLIFFDTSKCGE